MIQEYREVMDFLQATIHIFKNPVIIWQTFVGLISAFAPPISLVMFLIYTATGIRRSLQGMLLVMIVYVLLKGVDSAL